MSNEMLQDDGQEQEGVIADINRGAPFKQAALGYLHAGWFPFPLKPMAKEPWASGVTGRKNAFPGADVPVAEGGGPGGSLEAAQIGEWLAEAPRRANVGLWLREDVIGIDVDAYDDRSGAETLATLEETFGKLPATWISSARKDGISGIRFFKIPSKWAGKLQWSGKAGKNIDIIQTGHRFAGVWPSWNPDAQEMYQWYKPGGKPDGNPVRNFDVQVQDGLLRLNQLQYFPRVDDLPELPAKWVEYLTRGYIERTLKPIDMESTGREVEAWAKKFKPSRTVERNGRSVRVSCREVETRLAKAKERIEEDSASHGQLVNGHWSLLNCGIEGHVGVMLAVKKFEKFWAKDVLEEREKRGLGEANNEIYRSRIEALRKIKGRADEIESSGGNWARTSCGCPDPTVSLDPPSGDAPKADGTPEDPDKYDMTDDGNADHLVAQFGDRLIWVPGYGTWMYWNSERWIRDEDGLARRCWRVIRDRQKNFALSLLNKATEVGDMAGTDSPEYKKAMAKAVEWQKFARRSGSNVGANGALEAAQANEGISVAAEIMDRDERLLGVENGVLYLNAHGAAEFREARREDFVTVNTGVKYMDPDQLSKAGGDIAIGRELWNNYLDRFIPNLELRTFVQRALGYCLLGTNEQRLAIFLYGGTSTGKSTMLNAVLSALGGYSETVDLAIFKEKASGLNPALAQAMPRRVITSSEAGQNNHMHADLFKRMTGNDRLSAELKGVNVIVTRVPAFTPVIATNSPPTIQGADAALHKRLLVIPFNESVDEAHDEKSAAADLGKYGKEVVLSWLVDGWEMYATKGLNRNTWPAVVTGETKQFSSGLSHIGEFIEERLERGEHISDSESVAASDVYDAFVLWCQINNVPQNQIPAKNGFGRQMTGMGFVGKNVRDPELGKSPRRYLQTALIDPTDGALKIKKAR